jgi:exopolysaccharide biosynthesis polyprenyl glycosylphosphotransferase
MKARRRRDLVFVLLGDVMVMVIALWLAVVIRNLEIPSALTISLHLQPFGYLFLLSLLVFYISGLYEPHTVVLRARIPGLLVQASLFNALFGLGLFYFFPFVGIAPKVTFILYLILSFSLLVAWRLYGGASLGFRPKEPAVLFGGGDDLPNLVKAVKNASFYGLEFVKVWNLDEAPIRDFDQEIAPLLKRTHINTIALDLAHPHIGPLLPRLQEYQFQGVHFLDQSRVYEDLFDRVSLSLIGYAWILEHTSSRAHFGYDLVKRLTDITLSLVLLLASLILYPFVALAIKLEDGGPVFLFQERVGERNHLFTIVKFRSMKTSDRGKWVVNNDPRITKVGKFLRVTRIDELPQLWNVLIGDLSLIGPRPELPDLVKYYNAIIPYYGVRHLVKPGLSGWAQVHHDKPPHSVEETKEKLAYDLYYLKHRNIMLDLRIALKTIKTLLSRTGV